MSELQYTAEMLDAISDSLDYAGHLTGVGAIRQLRAQLATAQERLRTLEAQLLEHAETCEESAHPISDRVARLIAAGNAMTPFLSCTGAWVEDRSKHDCPGCKALTAWLAGSAGGSDND